MSIRRGLFYSFGQTGGQFFIQFFSAMIIARLLPPSEMGVAAVALAAIAILEALREFGVQQYLLKEPKLTEDKIRTVFGVALLVSWSMATAVLLCRHIMADFYDEPRLVSIFAVLSISFFVLPIGLPGGGMLRRERRYRDLSIIVLSATLANTVVSILLAFLGFGPISLAWGTAAWSCVLVAMTLVYKSEHLTLRPSLKEWRSIGAFGSLASLDSVVTTMGAQLPQIMIGKAFAFADVGHYVRSDRLAGMVRRLFQSSVSWVAESELGEKHRSGEPIQPMLLKVISFSTVVAWPALIFMALEAGPIIELLFGKTWLAAAPFLQALCIAQLSQIIVGQAVSVYVATGDIKMRLRNNIVIQAIGVILLLLGLTQSALLVAWLRVVMGGTSLVVHMSVMRKYAGINYPMLLRAVALPATITTVFGAMLLFLRQFLPETLNDNPLSLFPKAGSMAVVYVVLLVVFRHPLVDEFRRLLRQKRGTT